MNNQMKRTFGTLGSFVLIAFFVLLTIPVSGWAAPAESVILLMTDGTSSHSYHPESLV